MIKGLGALALVAFAAPAIAQAPATAPAPDAQLITRAQGEEMVKGMFAQLDLNHDGVIDAAEQKAVLDAIGQEGATPAMIAGVQKMLTGASGPDGKVTLASFMKTRMAAFDKADTNHDGKLDAAEIAASRAAAER
jgi:hypothetical protein